MPRSTWVCCEQVLNGDHAGSQLYEPCSSEIFAPLIIVRKLVFRTLRRTKCLSSEIIAQMHAPDQCSNLSLTDYSANRAGALNAASSSMRCILQFRTVCRERPTGRSALLVALQRDAAIVAEYAAAPDQ